MDIASVNEDSVMVVLPSDHYISDSAECLHTILAAVDEAKRGSIACIGAPIHRPETGYGYIRKAGKHSPAKVEAFVEKPTKELATEYMEDGSYVWNTGIFVSKCSVFLDEIRRHSPGLLEDCKEAYQAKIVDSDFLRIPEEKFKLCENISVDYALMEKTRRAVVFDMRTTWSDLGSWASVWENSKKKV